MRPGKARLRPSRKALREWIDHLPLANPAATGRLLLNALREMNQLRLDPAQRVAALEALRGPTAQVIVSLDRTVNADTFPLPAAKQQLGQQISDFDREMALGYTALVHDICAPAGAVPFLRGKAVTLALVRAIQHYGALLYRAYVLYLSPPPGVWQMLHDLFRFAVAVRLDEKPVADPLNPGIESSVRGAYMNTLLYAEQSVSLHATRERRNLSADAPAVGVLRIAPGPRTGRRDRGAGRERYRSRLPARGARGAGRRRVGIPDQRS
jgi:hypothetical protein